MFGRKSGYQQYVEKMRSLEPFHSLDRRAAGRAASLTTTLLRPPGSVLWRDGDAALETVIVVRGEVLTLWIGGQSEVIGPGGVVGAHELLARSRRMSTAVVATDAELLVMTRREFRALLSINPVVRATILGATGLAEHPDLPNICSETRPGQRLYLQV